MSTMDKVRYVENWDFENICKELLNIDHVSHEEIVSALQKEADPRAIPYLESAILLKPKLTHLAYDDYGAFYNRCLHALRAIGTTEALAVITKYSESENPVLKEKALYRLKRISEQAHNKSLKSDAASGAA